MADSDVPAVLPPGTARPDFDSGAVDRRQYVESDASSPEDFPLTTDDEEQDENSIINPGNS